jgi:type VI secretion system protein ImpH
VRLLKRFAGQESASSAPAKSPVEAQEFFWREIFRSRPELSLEFPGKDIAAIETRTEKSGSDGLMRYTITATFLGLYGASSPLPSFYTEDLMDEARDDQTVARDFVDIVNSPLYALHFLGWTKYRLALKILEDENFEDLERLYCLLGFGGDRIRSLLPDPAGLIRYIGLFMQAPRSALGLEALLRDAIGQPQLSVISCVLRVAAIPEDQLCRLGISGNRLGKDIYLGSWFRDRMGKFRVRIGPVNWQTCQEWLPGSGRYGQLGHLIRVYLDQPLEWDLELVLDRDEAQTARLGVDSGSRLGWNSWAFAGESYQGQAKAYFQT